MTETDIHVTDENGDKLKFQIRRMRSGRWATMEMKMKVVMNEDSLKACVEKYRISGHEVPCDLDHAADDGQDSSHTTPVLHPVGTGAGS